MPSFSSAQGFSANSLREALEQNSEIELQPLYRAKEQSCDYQVLPLYFSELTSSPIFYLQVMSWWLCLHLGCAQPGAEKGEGRIGEFGGAGVEICFVKSSASQKKQVATEHFNSVQTDWCVLG